MLVSGLLTKLRQLILAVCHYFPECDPYLQSKLSHGTVTVVYFFQIQWGPFLAGVFVLMKYFEHFRFGHKCPV